MSASLGLYRLQQVDRQIERTRSQLDTIRQTLENDSELRNALSQLEIAKAAHQHASHDLKNVEAEAESQKIKIDHAESSLYGGKVQNPKELQDLQKEVTSLKKQVLILEERELEAMLKVENAENDLQNAKTNLELVQARLGNEHKKLIIDQSALSLELERLTEEREATLTPIDGGQLQTYENLRQQKRGVAVAEIIDNSCASCGSTLNAALQQSARSQNQLAYCSSCGRILYSN